MTITRKAHLVVPVLLAVSFWGARPGQAETAVGVLKPTPSHGTGIEKKVVMPHDVLKQWKAVKLAVINKSSGTENIYAVPIGVPYKVPSSALTIVVEAFMPAFIMEGTTITTSSNRLENPAARISISEAGTPIFRGWLFLKFPNTHAIAHPKYAVSMIGAVPYRYMPN